MKSIPGRLPKGIQIARLTPNGSPDRGFGDDGSVRLRIPRLDQAILRLDERGRILIAASIKGRGSEEAKELALIGLRDNGSLDPSFGHDGMVRIPFPPSRYPEVDLEALVVRGDRAALLAEDCSGKVCRPVVAMVDLFTTAPAT